jgi:hypothetical protein
MRSASTPGCTCRPSAEWGLGTGECWGETLVA